MKRLIAAVILLLFVSASAVLSFFATRHYCNTLLTNLDTCQSVYKDGQKETAAELAAEFSEDWQKAHFTLAAFVNRGEIDNIEMSVARMVSFAHTQDDCHFFAECNQIQMLIEDMLERESLSLLTIF